VYDVSACVITLHCNGHRYYSLFIFQYLQILFNKIINKNAYYRQKFSTTGCSFSKPAPASTNGYWFSGCCLTSILQSLGTRLPGFDATFAKLIWLLVNQNGNKHTLHSSLDQSSPDNGEPLVPGLTGKFVFRGTTLA